MKVSIACPTFEYYGRGVEVLDDMFRTIANQTLKDVEVVEEKQSTLYYFYSNGCGFCKKLEPIIDKLNTEGHNILKLDLAEKDNQGLKKELSDKYKKQCGTPWLIDASNGHQVCGFRDEETIMKWVNGEDVPAPPRPNLGVLEAVIDAQAAPGKFNSVTLKAFDVELKNNCPSCI